jgi:hypothetical protein
MTWSGGGAPHSVWSFAVWASLTRVASQPRVIAPWSFGAEGGGDHSGWHERRSAARRSRC